MNTEGIVEINTSFLLDRRVSVARGVARFNKSQTQVWLPNFTAEHKLINKVTTVAFLEDFAEVGKACNYVCASPNAYATEASEPTINPALSKQRKEKIRQTPITKHRIVTDDRIRPLRQTPCRISPKEREAIRRQVDEMLRDDVIKP